MHNSRLSHESQPLEIRPLFPCEIYVHNAGMFHGYARVSTEGQSVDAQARQLAAAGCEKVFWEVASGAQTGRVQLRRLLNSLATDDVVTVTRHDRLAHQQQEARALREQGETAAEFARLFNVRPTTISRLMT